MKQVNEEALQAARQFYAYAIRQPGISITSGTARMIATAISNIFGPAGKTAVLAENQIKANEGKNAPSAIIRSKAPQPVKGMSEARAARIASRNAASQPAPKAESAELQRAQRIQARKEAGAQPSKPFVPPVDVAEVELPTSAIGGALLPGEVQEFLSLSPKKAAETYGRDRLIATLTQMGVDETGLLDKSDRQLASILKSRFEK